LDSNGGSDFDAHTVADTSEAAGSCGIPQPGCTAGADTDIRVDVSVGDGSADSCAASHGMNVVVTVPVHTTIWRDMSGGSFSGCSGDGVLNAGDLVLSE